MKEFDKRMACYQGIIDNHILYAVLEGGNAICKVDLLKKQVEIEAWLDAETSHYQLYYAVIKCNHYLAVIPGAANKLCIYNIKLNTTNYHEIQEYIDDDKSENDSIEKFWKGLSVNNCFYYFGYAYPFIVKINIDTLDIKWINLKEIGQAERYFEGAVVYGDSIYAPSSESGNIVSLNYQTNTIKVYRNIFDSRKLHGIIVIFNEIWIITTKGYCSILSKWSPQKGILDDIFVEEGLQKEVYWWNPLQVGNYVYLFQMNGNMAYRIDIPNEEVLLLDEITNAIGEIPEWQSKYLIRLIGNDGHIIYFCSAWNRKWFSYDTVIRKVEEFFIEIEDEEFKRRYWNQKYTEYNSKGYIEEKEIPLDIFLNMVDK